MLHVINVVLKIMLMVIVVMVMAVMVNIMDGVKCPSGFLKDHSSGYFGWN